MAGNEKEDDELKHDVDHRRHVDVDFFRSLNVTTLGHCSLDSKDPIESETLQTRRLLAGFARGGRVNVYTGAWRVLNGGH